MTMKHMHTGDDWRRAAHHLYRPEPLPSEIGAAPRTVLSPRGQYACSTCADPCACTSPAPLGTAPSPEPAPAPAMRLTPTGT
ncbi:hypothetical protein GCM10010245_82700 [Streptomyces spectabilis]|nr:hypothetical protein GCM10010245_82700 [Streptomyces spectabilis]